MNIEDAPQRRLRIEHDVKPCQMRQVVSAQRISTEQEGEYDDERTKRVQAHNQSFRRIGRWPDLGDVGSSFDGGGHEGAAYHRSHR